MSQPEASSSRRRGKYASRACNACRRRKSKCDGIQPVCQACAVTGQECSWSTEGDEAYRPATKQLVEGLRAKIQLLESEVAQLRQRSRYLGIDPSGAALGHDGPLIPNMMAGHISPSGSHSQTSTPQMQDDLPLAQYIHSVRLDPLPGGRESANKAQTPPRPHLEPLRDSVVQPLLVHPAKPTQPHSPIVPFVLIPDSDGMSTLLTYQYIFNIDISVAPEAQPPEHRASMECHWNRYLPDLGDIQLSRHEHDTLLSRCFSYGAAWFFGLIPDLFLRDMLEFLSPDTSHMPGDLQHYSPLLHCSLLAFIAPLSSDPAIRAKGTRGLFATCAKQWLDQEFKFSNPSLLPSLILLSEYHIGIGEMNAGHMYIGMSMRAARAGYVPASPARDWYHWSTFIQEMLVAREMQRPSEMPAPTVAIVPPVPIELSGKAIAGESVLDILAHTDFTGISARCFIENIKLLLISTKVTDVLQGVSAPIDVRIELDGWFDTLPDPLVIRQRSTFTSPPVLALHIRYWWSILDLYLPLFDSTDHAASQPMKMCSRATEKLLKLFGTYDTQFGFQYFPRNLLKAFYTCGRGLLLERSQVTQGTKKRAAVQEGINFCLRGLRAVGENWSGAELFVQDLGTRVASTLEWAADGVNE